MIVACKIAASLLHKFICKTTYLSLAFRSCPPKDLPLKQTLDFTGAFVPVQPDGGSAYTINNSPLFSCTFSPSLTLFPSILAFLLYLAAAYKPLPLDFPLPSSHTKRFVEASFP